MHLVLVIASMSGGGAERVLAYLANAWVSNGWSITLLTLDAAPSFYPLDPRIRHHPLGVAGTSSSLIAGVANNLRRVAVLRRSICSERPAAVVGFMDATNVLSILAVQGSGVPVIVSEWVEPSQHDISRHWRILRRL